VNWLKADRWSVVTVGTFLAVLIVASAPNFGLKYALSAPVPSVILAFIGMWLAWTKRRSLWQETAQRRWALVVMLLMVPILLSIPGSIDRRFSGSIAVALGVYYFTGVALIHVLADEQRRATVARWTFWILAFWMVDSIVQVVFGHDLFGIAITDDGRVTGPFFGNLRQSLFMAVLLPVAFYAMQRDQRHWATSVGFLLAAAILATLSGARASMVMIAIAFFAIVLHLPRSRAKWILIAALPVIVAIGISVSPTVKQRLALFAEVKTFDFETADRLLSYRVGIWETAMNMVIRHPVTGVGAGVFDKAYHHYTTRPDHYFAAEKARPYHAHQPYVAMVAETGITGLVALVASISMGFVWYWRSGTDRRRHAWPFAAGLAVYVFPLNSQPPLFNHYLFPVILLLLCAMLAALGGQDLKRTAARDDSPSSQ